jgi:acetolactate synthase-1/2/3 large subunit
VPVIASWRRPDAFPNGHPLYLGMCGIAAAPTVLPRILEADVLLVLGSRLSEVTSFGYRVPGEGTRWIHVDAEPDETHSGRNAPAIGLVSDAGRFVDAALSLLRGAAIDAEGRDARLRAAADDREAYIQAASATSEGEWDGPGVHPGRVVSTVGKLVAPETIITTDAGNFGGWLARGYRFRRPGTFVGPTSGAMGYGFPAAIAAALMYPRRHVVAFCGDGGFAMSMSEVETAVREGIAPIALVFDNRRYGTIAMHQEREGRMPIATNLGAIDFAAVARAQGAMGVSIGHDDQVGDVVAEALQAGRPAVIQMELDPRWISVDQPASGGAVRGSTSAPPVAAPATEPIDGPSASADAGDLAPSPGSVGSTASPMATDIARAP